MVDEAGGGRDDQDAKKAVIHPATAPQPPTAEPFSPTSRAVPGFPLAHGERREMPGGIGRNSNVNNNTNDLLPRDIN
jgi:hypothetical protein